MFCQRLRHIWIRVYRYLRFHWTIPATCRWDTRLYLSTQVQVIGEAGGLDISNTWQTCQTCPLHKLKNYDTTGR